MSKEKQQLGTTVKIRTGPLCIRPLPHDPASSEQDRLQEQIRHRLALKPAGLDNGRPRTAILHIGGNEFILDGFGRELEGTLVSEQLEVCGCKSGSLILWVA